MLDLLVKLYDLPDSDPHVRALRARGTLVRGARAYERREVTQWVGEAFGERWRDECDAAFGNRPVSCLIATAESEIVGFACYDATCKGYFGPMGVATHARRQGIGAALTLSCLQAMSAFGYAYAIIGAAGAVEFYTKLVGAVAIAGSSPGIYRERLGKPVNR